jgi:hypothetical protein
MEAKALWAIGTAAIMLFTIFAGVYALVHQKGPSAAGVVQCGNATCPLGQLCCELRGPRGISEFCC